MELLITGTGFQNWIKIFAFVQYLVTTVCTFSIVSMAKIEDFIFLSTSVIINLFVSLNVIEYYGGWNLAEKSTHFFSSKINI